MVKYVVNLDIIGIFYNFMQRPRGPHRFPSFAQSILHRPCAVFCCCIVHCFVIGL